MKKFLLFTILLNSWFLFSQEVELKGEVFDEYLEPFPNAIVTTSDGKSTTSDHEGAFTVKTTLPVTITVSFIGYSPEKTVVTSEDDQIGIILKENSGLDQIVLSATRTPERLFESPVTIRRISLNDIKKTPSVSFYEALENLRNVDMKTNSQLLKSINTKGISTIRNVRFVQLIDGVDNIYPVAGVSPGNLVGLVDMDVENVEILEGASSALYGANAFNGVLSIRSKNPFEYKGISAKLQGGVTNGVNGSHPFYNPSVRFAYKFDDRLAAKASFSYHTAAEWKHNDYRSTNRAGDILDNVQGRRTNYNGINVSGDDLSLHQKTFPFLNFLGRKVRDLRLWGNLAGANRRLQQGGLDVESVKKLKEKIKGLTGYQIKLPNGDLLQGIEKNGVTIYPNGEIFKNMQALTGAQIGMAFSGDNEITREGFQEPDMSEDRTRNIKFNTSIHWRPFGNKKLEAIWTSRFNQATDLFDMGPFRLQNKDISMSQHILELRNEDFFVRGFRTSVHSGNTYALSLLGGIATDAWQPSKDWFRAYILESTNQKVGYYLQNNKLGVRTPEQLAGIIFADSNPKSKEKLLFKDFTWDPKLLAQIDKNVRTKINNGVKIGNDGRTVLVDPSKKRPAPGSPKFNAILQKVRNTPIGDQGAWLVDNSKMYNVEGNFNFARYIDFAEIQVGANYRKYLMNAYGVMSRTPDEVVGINELGVYTQIRKKMFDKRLDITASGRYDKVDEIDGMFSPRLSIGYTAGENRNHNFRISAQKAYRQPSVENRVNMLNLPMINKYTIGNTPSNRKRLDTYMETERTDGGDDPIITPVNNEFISKVGFEKSSFLDYYSKFVEAIKGAYTFDEILANKNSPDFDIIKTDRIQDKLRPEQLVSFELGYRGMIDVSATNILELDISGYYNHYKDFIRMTTIYIPGIMLDADGKKPAAIQPDAGDVEGQKTGNIQDMSQLFRNKFALAVLQTISQQSAEVSFPKNSTANVNTYGIGISSKIRLWSNYKLALNYAWNDYHYHKNGDEGFIPAFNTSKHNVKMMFGNENVFKNIGFNVAARWQSGYHWYSELVNGDIDARTVVDAQISYSIPKIKSRFKLGANNLFGKHYYDNIGNGLVGNIYYLSWIIND